MASTGQYGFLDSKNLIGIWDEMYEPALNGVWATQIGSTQNSDRGIEDYGWLGSAPNLEELTDDNANEEQLKKYRYFLQNVEFAKALRIKATDMRRDRLGQIRMRVGEMSQKAAEHWNDLTSRAIVGNGAGYDGQPFFSTTHNEAAGATDPISNTAIGNQSNALDSTQLSQLDVVAPTAPTPLEAAQALNAVIGQFYTLLDDHGSPMNGQARKFKILVGTSSLYSPFAQATSLMTFAQGAQNPVLGLKENNGVELSVELIPQLRSVTDSFFVFRTDGPVKAMLLQSEVDVTPAVSNEQNDEYIKFRRYLFGIYASRAVGYLRWQSAMRAHFS